MFKWNSEGEATLDRGDCTWLSKAIRTTETTPIEMIIEKDQSKNTFSSCLSLPIYSFDDYFNGKSKYDLDGNFPMKVNAVKSHRGDLVAVWPLRDF
jgi:hypothetical protein